MISATTFLEMKFAMKWNAPQAVRETSTPSLPGYAASSSSAVEYRNGSKSEIGPYERHVRTPSTADVAKPAKLAR